MRIANIESDKGNKVPNQFIIYAEDGTYFQSYDSVIAKVDYGCSQVTLGEDYNYSKTTMKYRNIFFRDYVGLDAISTTKELEKALKDGKFIAYGREWHIKLDNYL